MEPAKDNAFITLNNGLKFPLVGFGTWRIIDPESEKATLKSAVRDAGYRHIDTATLYQHEHIVG